LTKRRGQRILNIGMRTLTVTVIAAVLAGIFATAALSHTSASWRSEQAHSQSVVVGLASRSMLPDRADWERIKASARTRRIALAPHHTARFRAFAGYLGLRELATIHPLAPGPCATAVTYLRNNLLDLANAHPGENWAPLRRLVAKEPSIRVCAPRQAR
jgi:hypothetical protein